MSADPTRKCQYPKARAIGALRSDARRAREEDQLQTSNTCGDCGWSWPAGQEGCVLCGNADAPYFGDVVPMDLSCEQQGMDSESE